MIRHNVWFGFFVHYVFVYPQSWMKVFDMLQRERKIVLRVSFDLWTAVLQRGQVAWERLNRIRVMAKFGRLKQENLGDSGRKKRRKGRTTAGAETTWVC